MYLKNDYYDSNKRENILKSSFEYNFDDDISDYGYNKGGSTKLNLSKSGSSFLKGSGSLNKKGKDKFSSKKKSSSGKKKYNGTSNFDFGISSVTSKLLSNMNNFEEFEMSEDNDEDFELEMEFNEEMNDGDIELKSYLKKLDKKKEILKKSYQNNDEDNADGKATFQMSDDDEDYLSDFELEGNENSKKDEDSNSNKLFNNNIFIKSKLSSTNSIFSSKGSLFKQENEVKISNPYIK